MEGPGGCRGRWVVGGGGIGEVGAVEDRPCGGGVEKKERTNSAANARRSPTSIGRRSNQWQG